MSHIFWSYIFPSLLTFLICMAFCVLFNIHGAGVLVCCAGGVLGWLVYLGVQELDMGQLVAALLAGVVISAWSELMARLRKCPVTGYLLVAFFPLVPGGGIYYAMEQAIQGRNQEFAATLMNTLGIAGGLAVGVLMVSSGVRMIRVLRAKREGKTLGKGKK